MKFFYFKDRHGVERGFGLFFPLDNGMENLYLRTLQERIFAECREILEQYLPEKRPAILRSEKYFGSIHNPDTIFLDNGEMKRVNELD